MSHKNGFSLIEILIVIAILGILASLILAAVGSSRNKGYDTRIRNDVGQIRWLAESVYDSQGARYIDWSQHSTIQQNLNIILEDIDANYGDTAGAPYVTTIRDSQVATYCTSAPLRAQVGKHYCIDSTGVFRTTDSGCPEDTGTGSLCPGN